jgi:hypothetical protein
MESTGQGLSDAAQQQPVIERQSAPDFFDSSLEWRRVFAEAWGRLDRSGFRVDS